MAGAYGLTLLYGLLPPLMAWQLRGRQQAQQQRDGTGGAAVAAAGRGAAAAVAVAGAAEPGPLVPGGTPVLAAVFAVVAAITLGRVAADLGLPLDSVAAQLAQAAGLQ